MNSCEYITTSVLLLPTWSETTLRRETRRVEMANYRARKSNRKHGGNRQSTLTVDEWLDILVAHGWRCAYCGGPVETLEHVRPLVWGGDTSAANCVPACEACNHERNHMATALDLLARVRWHVAVDLLRMAVPGLVGA